MKVASILHYGAHPELIKFWVLTLPTDMKYRTLMKLLEKAKDFQYITWRERLGFRFWKKREIYLPLENEVQSIPNNKKWLNRVLHKEANSHSAALQSVGKVVWRV